MLAASDDGAYFVRHWRDGGPWTYLVPLITYMHLLVPCPPEPAGGECTMCVFVVCAGVGCTPPSVDWLPLVFVLGFVHVLLCALLQARHFGKVLCPIHVHFQSFTSFCAPCGVPRCQFLNRCQVLMGTHRRRSSWSTPDLVHAKPRNTSPHPRGPMGTGHASPANA